VIQLVLLIATIVGVVTILSSGCSKPTAPKDECVGVFVNGECEEVEDEDGEQ